MESDGQLLRQGDVSGTGPAAPTACPSGAVIHEAIWALNKIFQGTEEASLRRWEHPCLNLCQFVASRPYYAQTSEGQGDMITSL